MRQKDETSKTQIDISGKPRIAFLILLYSLYIYLLNT